MAQELILIPKPKYEKMLQDLKKVQFDENHPKTDNNEKNINKVDEISKIDQPKSRKTIC